MGKDQGKGGAFANITVHREFPLIFSNKCSDIIQAQSRAFSGRFRGEKWVEDFFGDSRGEFHTLYRKCSR